MSYDDVVIDTTKKFILKRREYVELAFVVEKVVPLIRDGVIEKILRYVQNDLRQRFNERSDSSLWSVKFIESEPDKPQAVQIKKRSWKCGDGTDWPQWQGVRLDRDWDGANITVSPFENVTPDAIQRICDEQQIGASRIRRSYVYCGLEDNLKDWDGADFVFDAWSKPEKVAGELAQKMEGLAKKIDGVLS